MAKSEYSCTDVKPVVLYAYDGTVLRQVQVDVNGELLMADANAVLPKYDYIEAVLDTDDTWIGATYKIGGASGTTVATISTTRNTNGTLTSMTITVV